MPISYSICFIEIIPPIKSSCRIDLTEVVTYSLFHSLQGRGRGMPPRGGRGGPPGRGGARGGAVRGGSRGMPARGGARGGRGGARGGPGFKRKAEGNNQGQNKRGRGGGADGGNWGAQPIAQQPLTKSEWFHDSYDQSWS